MTQLLNLTVFSLNAFHFNYLYSSIINYMFSLYQMKIIEISFLMPLMIEVWRKNEENLRCKFRQRMENQLNVFTSSISLRKTINTQIFNASTHPNWKWNKLQAEDRIQKLCKSCHCLVLMTFHAPFGNRKIHPMLSLKTKVCFIFLPILASFIRTVIGFLIHF